MNNSIQNFGSNVLRGAQGVGQAVGNFGRNIRDDLAYGAQVLKEGNPIKSRVANKMQAPKPLKAAQSITQPNPDSNQGFNNYYSKSLKDALNY